MSNTMCNCLLHTAFNITCMHDTYKRMMDAAKTNLGLTTPSAVALEINVAPNTFTNWKSRGVSENMFLKIARKLKCNPFWLETGEGEMNLIVQPSAEYSPNPGTPEHQVLRLMENMDQQTKYKLIKIGDTLVEPEGNGHSNATGGKRA